MTQSERKNPYHQDSPEWQLWENMVSAEAQARAFAADAERAQQQSQRCREKAERFRETLEKLKTAT
jgi:hypothetical protein